MAQIAKGEPAPHDAYDLRTALPFETASTAYSWLNRSVAVGVGWREPTGVTCEEHEIL